VTYKAGTVLLLLLLFSTVSGPAFCAAQDMFSPPDNVGASKIPRFGNVRIPVLILSDNDSAARSAAQRPLFGNDLSANTFRNYWSENSLSVYDARIAPLVASLDGKLFPAGGAADKDKWFMLIADKLRALADQGVYEPAAYDISGQTNTPDGRADGMIVLVDGLRGSFNIFPDEGGETTLGNVKPGPTLIAGIDASDYDILRGFAGLMGFADMGAGPDSKGGVCLSLSGIRADENGIPLLDGYSRLRAGWAREIKIDGPVRKLFLLPSRTSGDVYTIGGDSEYYVIENRAPGGLYDPLIKSAGLAIYRINENAGPAAKPDAWQPPVMNVWPDGSFPLQIGEPFNPDHALFRHGDYIESDYSFQNPLSEKFHQLNSNWLSGEPSDISISEIDTKTHFPIISAMIGFD